MEPLITKLTKEHQNLDVNVTDNVFWHINTGIKNECTPIFTLRENQNGTWDFTLKNCKIVPVTYSVISIRNKLVRRFIYWLFDVK